MFCSKCGEIIGSDSLFCHTCGSRIVHEIIEPEIPEPGQQAGEEVLLAIEALEAALPPEKRTIAVTKGKKEKEYFGYPALIFCLVIIGLLSVSTGVLATLYFGGF
jgi:hypothetical protein